MRCIKIGGLSVLCWKSISLTRENWWRWGSNCGLRVIWCLSWTWNWVVVW